MSVTTTTNLYGLDVAVEVYDTVKSNRNKIYGLNYPIGANPGNSITGSFSRVGNPGYFDRQSGLSLIKNNLRQFLLTNKGERVMIPDYGLNLRRYVFDQLDEVTVGYIRNDILIGLSKYFSSVKVLKLSIQESTADKSGRTLTGSFASLSNRLNIRLTLQIQDDSLETFDIGVGING